MKDVCRHLAGSPDQPRAADLILELEGDRRQEVVEHLRACSSCRQAAIEEDPTLVFGLLQPQPIEERQISELQSAVRTLRRSRAIDASNGPRARVSSRVAFLAASLLFALALLPLAGERPHESLRGPSLDVVSESLPRARPDWRQWVEDAAAPPVIEDLNRPEARIYQLTEDDLAVVMIVDETLDL